MGIRQIINENPVITSSVTGAIIAIALGFVIYQGCVDPRKVNVDTAWWSNDDGKTYYRDNAHQFPPIMKDGKRAYKASVVRCGSGEPFVSTLQRYPDKVKAKLEQMVAANGGKEPTTIEYMNLSMQDEVRRPATPLWYTRQSNPVAYMQNASFPLCENGMAATPVNP